MIAESLTRLLATGALAATSTAGSRGAGKTGAASEAETASTTVDTRTADAMAGIAGRYDPRSMSPRQMAAMSQELYQSGTISFHDHALLSFQPELNPADGTDLSQQLGSADAPKDFVAHWETQRGLHEQAGEWAFARDDQKILNILGNLSALREQSPAGMPTAA